MNKTVILLKKRFNIEIVLFIIFNVLFYTNSALEAHNIVFYNSVIKAFIAINILLLLLKTNKFFALLYLFLSIPLFLFGLINILKFFSFFFIFYISYQLVINYSSNIKKILVIIFFLNAIFILIEINGLIPQLAYYQIYYTSLPYENSLFVENAWFPLFQIRPSGLFHSTIYMSLEVIFIMAILMHPVKNNFLIVTITFVAVFSGSTAIFLSILILIASTIKVNGSKVIFKFFILILFWLLIYYFVYPSFFSYNYNYLNYIGSFSTRFDIDSTSSSFTANKNLFLALSFFMLLTSMLYLIANKYTFNTRYIYITILLIIMLTIHNFIFTLKFYMNIGLLIGFVNVYYMQKKSICTKNLIEK